MEIHKGSIIHICDFTSHQETNGKVLQLETSFYTNIIKELGMFVNGQWMKSHPDYLSESIIELPSKRVRRAPESRQVPENVLPPSLPPSHPAGGQTGPGFPVDTEQSRGLNHGFCPNIRCFLCISRHFPLWFGM